MTISARTGYQQQEHELVLEQPDPQQEHAPGSGM
jgi:hypothetical protein